MEKEKMQPAQMPVVDMCGSRFYLDVEGQVFRQVDNAANTIAMKEVVNPDTQITSFAYDTRTKNVYGEILHVGNVPEYVQFVILPPVGELLAQHDRQQDSMNNRQTNIIRQPVKSQKRKFGHRRSIH
ncbi:MAG: hypothetical protein JST19_10455 [Bacteroidetes bacterium]|nr:hypothetical protein [Bacteroidota bacterium]